jgi:phage recombination protein Bet
MTNDVAMIERAPRVSLIARCAERYGVEAGKFLDTLKATAFKTDKPVSNEQMMALLIVSEQYKLNPFTKELYAFPDKRGGIVPVVSIDGWARIINERAEYDGMAIEDGTDSCTVTMWRKDRMHPTVITEYLSECNRGTDPWRTHPRRMLRHKAVIQCARMAFGFAGIYDEDEAQRIVHMGPADEVTPTQGTQRMREAIAMSKPTDSLAAVITPADVEPIHYVDSSLPTGKSFAEYSADIAKSNDPDLLLIKLDEARMFLGPEQHAELLKQHYSKFHHIDEKE